MSLRDPSNALEKLSGVGPRVRPANAAKPAKDMRRRITNLNVPNKLRVIVIN